jgi:hypothetical protein
MRESEINKQDFTVIRESEFNKENLKIQDQAMINTVQRNSTFLSSTRLTTSQNDEEAEFEKFGRVNEENDGKIIKDENEEIIRVTSKTYSTLLE